VMNTTMDTILQKLIVPLLIVVLGLIFDLKGDVSATKAILDNIAPMVLNTNSIQIGRKGIIDWSGEHRKSVERHNHTTDHTPKEVLRGE